VEGDLTKEDSLRVERTIKSSFSFYSKKIVITTHTLTPMPEISVFGRMRVGQDSISRTGIQSLCPVSRNKECKSSELQNTGTDF
jgi:hypothetical protein